MKFFLLSITFFILLSCENNKKTDVLHNKAVILYKKAVFQNEHCNFYRVINFVNRLLKIDPNNANAYNLRAYAKFKNYDTKGAKADLTKSIQLNPENEYAYYKRAFIHSEAGNIQEALKDYTSAIKYIDTTKAKELKEIDRFYNAGNVYYERANIYDHLNQTDKALLDYTRSIELNKGKTESINPILIKALYLMNQGNYSAAIKLCDEGIKLFPHFQKAYLVVDGYRFNINDINGLAISVDKQNPENKEIDTDSIFKKAEKEVIYDMEYMYPFIQLCGLRAKSLFQSGKVQEAILQYDKILNLSPQNDKTYFNRAYIYNFLNNTKKAKEDCKKAIELNPQEKEYKQFYNTLK